MPGLRRSRWPRATQGLCRPPLGLIAWGRGPNWMSPPRWLHANTLRAEPATLVALSCRAGGMSSQHAKMARRLWLPELGRGRGMLVGTKGKDGGIAHPDEDQHDEDGREMVADTRRGELGDGVLGGGGEAAWSRAVWSGRRA